MTMENTCDIIVGLQHGDEGKGKVAHALLKQNEYDYCILYWTSVGQLYRLTF